MDTTTATAAKVTKAREKAGISVLALSDSTGIPRSTLTRMLAGKQSFTVAHIEAIADALEVDPTSLLEFRAAA